MHLSGETQTQQSQQQQAAGAPTANQQQQQQLPDYVLTADLLAERTLDGLLAEHHGELVRTGMPFVLDIRCDCGVECRMRWFLCC